MGALEFNKCCFCIDLKTGCFIIGYLSLICYIIFAAMGIVALAIGGAIAADKNKDYQHYGVTVFVVAALILLFTVLLLTFVITLLVGLHKNKPGHLKAYLVYVNVFIGISVIIFIRNMVSLNFNAKSLIQSIFGVLLNTYFMLVIRSQYLVMKHPEREPAYNTA